MGKLTKLRCAFFIGIVAAMAPGCATTPEDSSGPQGCVVVDNSEGSGAQARIFLVSISSGWRLGMGEVGMGRTHEFCTGRVNIPERVYVLIERPAIGGRVSSMDGNRPRPISSQEFVLRLGDVWTWDINLNRLSRAIVYQSPDF